MDQGDKGVSEFSKKKVTSRPCPEISLSQSIICYYVVVDYTLRHISRWSKMAIEKLRCNKDSSWNHNQSV